MISRLPGLSLPELAWGVVRRWALAWWRIRNGGCPAPHRNRPQSAHPASGLTAQQAAQSSNRNLVTRALGVEPNVLMEVNEFQVAPNDLFLLCSDGLTDMVSDSDLAELVRAPMPLEEKATLLIDTANANGGRDNVSVLLVQAAAGGKKRGLMSRLLGAS